MKYKNVNYVGSIIVNVMDIIPNFLFISCFYKNLPLNLLNRFGKTFLRDISQFNSTIITQCTSFAEE